MAENDNQPNVATPLRVNSQTASLPMSADVPRGAIVTTAYAERQVRALAVLETEVESLAVFNSLTTAFVSAGTALVSIAIGIWANGAFSEKLTPEGTVLSHFGAPIMCVIGGLMYCLAIWSYSKRTSTLDAIRAGSKSQR